MFIKSIFFIFFVLSGFTLVFAESGISTINGFDVKYSSQNTEIAKISFDQNLLTLTMTIDAQQDDAISIELPRQLLDSKISDSDDEFYLLVDGKESIYYETDTSAESRTISVPVYAENKQITIIGTETKVSAQSTSMPDTEQKKGCLIATAAFGTELSPQVQLLREVRDGVLYSTGAGTTFMAGFNEFYYAFSPAVADLERQSPLFKEVVKTAITPMLSTMSILNYANIDSEQEMLGYGIGVILLNIGMYFVVPAIVIVKLGQNLEKSNFFLSKT